MGASSGVPMPIQEKDELGRFHDPAHPQVAQAASKTLVVLPLR